jgi:hypothetical protein
MKSRIGASLVVGGVSFLLLSMQPAVRAQQQNKVFFTHYNSTDPTLETMTYSGSAVQDLFDPGNPFPVPDWLTVGLAVDMADGKIYWTHGSFFQGRIKRANLDGSNQETVISGLKGPRGVALDAVAGKVYWTDSPPEGNNSGLILRANADGSGGLETVFSLVDLGEYDTSSKVGRPTVDVVNGYVYFGANGEIKRVNIDGPPFNLYTVASGGSTITRVQVDVLRDCLYWIDSNTISNAVARLNLDDTGFEILYDFQSDSSSSGLSDLVVNFFSGDSFWSKEIGTKGVYRGDVFGNPSQIIHNSPAGYNAAGLELNLSQTQPMMDCNGNGTRDKDDVESGFSPDCNNNGTPDECEENPCRTPTYLVDQSVDVDSPGRQLGGIPTNQSWVVFQPFDVSRGGWEISAIELNGVTWKNEPAGFTATILPDTGGNYPDEAVELLSSDSFFRWDTVWVTLPTVTTLPEGRFWVRLVANNHNNYLATVSTVSAGLPSMSRSGLGNDFPDQPPIALRVLQQPPGSVPGLTVAKAGGVDITLSWDSSCVTNDIDYAIYEGSVTDFTSHVPVVPFCTTSGATMATITPAAADKYYLVVPQGDVHEGSYGSDSAGVPRPPSVSACKVQLVGGCE